MRKPPSACHCIHYFHYVVHFSHLTPLCVLNLGPGDKLGAYEIVLLGGVEVRGRVLLGQDHRLERIVAIEEGAALNQRLEITFAPAGKDQSLG